MFPIDFQSNRLALSLFVMIQVGGIHSKNISLSVECESSQYDGVCNFPSGFTLTDVTRTS